MVVLMTVAAVVSVLQLALLGSWARSLRVSSLLQAIVLGFLVCGPVVVCVQWLVTRGVAALGPWSLNDVVETASWTFDPVIEEVGKLLPLVVLAWRWPRIHRQLGWVDHLLAGAGIGMGFALAEAALRFARVGLVAMPTEGGYIVRASLGGAAIVPSVWTSLTTWQPAPVTFESWFETGTDSVHHLVWTSLAAVGLAWFVLGVRRLRWLGLVPLAAVSFDHAAFNANVAGVSADWVSALTEGFGHLLATLPVLVLIALVVVDRLRLARTREAHPGLLLDGEAANGLSPLPLLRAVGRGLPWSVPVTWQVVLERRAALNALAAGLPEPHFAVHAAADLVRLGRARDQARWTAAARRLLMSVDLKKALNWRTVLWAASLLPAVAYLVVGGFPATRGIQEWFSRGIGPWLLAGGLALGAVAVASDLPRVVRLLRSATDPSLHEARLRPGARLVTTAATLAAGVGLVAALGLGARGDSPIVRNFHILDALSSALLVLGIALIIAAFVFFPPSIGLAATTIGTVEVVASASAAFQAVAAAGGLSLALHWLLNEASDGSGGGSSGSSGSSSGGQSAWEAESVKSGRFSEADLPRLRDLSGDPAHGGARTPASWAEAEVGLGLEKQGLVRGLQRSPNAGEEFIDSARRAWDVKAFRSRNFNLERIMNSIQREVRAGENLMLDTRNLSAEDFLRLDDAIRNAGLGNRVLWWP